MHKVVVSCVPAVDPGRLSAEGARDCGAPNCASRADHSMSSRGGGVGSQLSQAIAPPTTNPWLVTGFTISGGRRVTTGGVPRVKIAHCNC